MKTFMSRGGSAITAALIGLAAVGCAPGLDQYQAQRRRVAPTSSHDLGIVASGVTEAELVALLAQHPEAHFRELNRLHGLYEIFGLSIGDVVRDLPGHEVSGNHFFKAEGQRPTLEVADFQKLATASTEPKRLEKCKESAIHPIAVMDVLKAQKVKRGSVAELGGSVTLSNVKSHAHPSHPSVLRKAWLVVPPEGSVESERLLTDEVVTIQFGDLGVYQIGLIVQDDQASCALELRQVAVTVNRPYLGTDAQIGQTMSPLDMAQFGHLAELHASEAWAISQGAGLTIAVIDSGVNYNHPALRDSIAVNTKERAGNGTDDDHNGFADDVIGYDFANGDAFPYDDDGHGSHVSGLAASKYFGLAKQARILAIKALGPSGGDGASVAAGILYAVDQGARIINLSLGSYGLPLPALVRAVDYAESKGVLIVAAAGNGDPMTGVGVNTDQKPNFPSALPNDNILAVAAKGTNVLLAPFSNYGLNTVDVVAPGGSGAKDLILSAYKENTKQSLFVGEAGTSMAAPIVSGIAADVWSLNPNLTARELKRLLMASGTEVPALKTVVQSGRYIDALDAVRRAPGFMP